MNKVTIAAVQMSCSGNVEENIKKADSFVREAASKGANVILLPELFERQYFCQERRYEYYSFAQSVGENRAVKHFRGVAAELGVVIPVSFYEKDQNNLYNSVAMTGVEKMSPGDCPQVTKATGEAGPYVTKATGEAGANVPKATGGAGANVPKATGGAGANVTKATGEAGPYVPKATGEAGPYVTKATGEAGANVTKATGEAGANVPKADCISNLVYRKTHIPDDHFYQEKFYFTPGNTGFRVWDTQFGHIGVGICWDQWFPEAARSMALLGADFLLYPTAIGSEPILECDSMPHWRRCMQGHSAANLMPVIAANRIGLEKVTPCAENGGQSSALVFYGSSFMTDGTGEIVEQASRDREEILLHTYDLEALATDRLSWGIFRDRRPELYSQIFS